MIRIRRTQPAPAALGAGAVLVAAMHRAVVARPGVAGHAGEPFQFDNNIYGHETVKAALIGMQHEKCAYCEGLFRAFSYGDVEHQRPKGYSQQGPRQPINRPGYYWLAYDWDNLLFSCEQCNRSRKRNLFPLRNPAARATTPAMVAGEQPMLLDPSGPADPRDHIRFGHNVPEALTDIGERTIDCLNLDRIPLNAARLRHLKAAVSLTKLVRHGAIPGAGAETRADAIDAANELAVMVQETEPFSAMILGLLGR